MSAKPSLLLVNLPHAGSFKRCPTQSSRRAPLLTGGDASACWLWLVYEYLETMQTMENGMSKRNVSFKVSGGQVLPNGFSVTIPAEIGFEGLTTDQLIDMTLSSLKIDLQRWMRNKTPEFLEELAKRGYKCHATECGRAAVSDQELIALLLDLGMDSDSAKEVVADASKRAKLVAKLRK